MDETDINWDNWRLFLAVAREQGLAGAARVTGKSAPTLGRRMHQLEQLTGKELFHRHPQGYKLTQDGLNIFNTVASVEAGLNAINSPDQSHDNPLVKVSAGTWMTYGLCKNIHEITQTANNVRIRFLSAEAILDISRRETTIGIRNIRPTQNNLVCRKLGHVHFAGYAKNENTKPWISILQDTPSSKWLRNHHNNTTDIEVSSPRNALDILSAGNARAVLPTFIGDKTEGLVKVTPIIKELSHNQWLVTHPDEQGQTAVRKVIDGIYQAAKSLHAN